MRLKGTRESTNRYQLTFKNNNYAGSYYGNGCHQYYYLWYL